MANMHSLPAELTQCIMMAMGPRDLSRFTRTCRYTMQLARDSVFLASYARQYPPVADYFERAVPALADAEYPGARTLQCIDMASRAKPLELKVLMPSKSWQVGDIEATHVHAPPWPGNDTPASFIEITQHAGDHARAVKTAMFASRLFEGVTCALTGAAVLCLVESDDCVIALRLRPGLASTSQNTRAAASCFNPVEDEDLLWRLNPLGAFEVFELDPADAAKAST